MLTLLDSLRSLPRGHVSRLAAASAIRAARRARSRHPEHVVDEALRVQLLAIVAGEVAH